MKAKQKILSFLAINIYLTIQVLTSTDIKNNGLNTLRVKESKTIKNGNINIRIYDNQNDINYKNETNSDDYQYPDNSYYYENYQESDSEESQVKDDEAFESLLDNEEYETNSTYDTSQNVDESLEKLYEDYIFSDDKNILNSNFSQEEIKFLDQNQEEKIFAPKTIGDNEMKSKNVTSNFRSLLIILSAIAIVSLILIIVLAFIFRRKLRDNSSKKSNYEKVNQNDASINSVKAQVPNEII